MTTAEKVAEEVFRVIERERRIVKADLVEAVEKVLRVNREQVERELLAAGAIYGIG